MLLLNENHIEEELDHKNLQMTTIKYLSFHRKHRYELVCYKKTSQQNYIREELATKVIVYCRTTAAHKFRSGLGFKKYNIILTKEQSVLSKIKSSLAG